MDPSKKKTEMSRDRVAADSKLVATAAIRLAITKDRAEEKEVILALAKEGFIAAAVDVGGDFITSVSRTIERAVVAARREGLIGQTYTEEGAVAGAAHEAMEQLVMKATGLNIGGKIGIVRFNNNVSVCAYFGIGLLHLDEAGIGLGHRAM